MNWEQLFILRISEDIRVTLKETAVVPVSYPLTLPPTRSMGKTQANEPVIGYTSSLISLVPFVWRRFFAKGETACGLAPNDFIDCLCT